LEERAHRPGQGRRRSLMSDGIEVQVQWPQRRSAAGTA